MKYLIHLALLMICLTGCDSCKRCKDPKACNYDEKGSCEYVGCTGCKDPTACNYDGSYEFHDHSYCTYNTCIRGCMDPTSLNYNANATVDDGSCNYSACTDPNACNYNPDALHDDGTCEYTSCAGCMDANACNYDANATISNGLCEYTSCAGCMDQNAQNYNYLATIDNGSCDYSCTLTGEVRNIWIQDMPITSGQVRFDILVNGVVRMSTANKTYTEGTGVSYDFNDLTYNAAGNNSIIEFASTDMTMTLNLYINNVLTETADHSSCGIRKIIYNSLNQPMVVPKYAVGGFGYDVYMTFDNVTY